MNWVGIEKGMKEDKSSLPICGKMESAKCRAAGKYLFKEYSLGVNTNRDEWVYDYSKERLQKKLKIIIETYNSEVDRWKRFVERENPDDPNLFIDQFVLNDERRIKWSSKLKELMVRDVCAIFDKAKIRKSLYRPFTTKELYFDGVMIHRRGQLHKIVPLPDMEVENRIICVPGLGNRKDFGCLISNLIPTLDLAFEKAQCFPFYVYDEDGSNRRENITDWALEEFRKHYGNREIAKWDIFYYVYGVLHHAGYREKFAENLKRELPRIPLAGDFGAFAAAGRELARLHLEYETLEPWPLEMVENPQVPFTWRVTDKMRLNKEKTELKVNESLTLRGIPAEAFEYRLGNRSALEWVIDQYQVKEDARSGIRSDPNREDDEEYIVRLAGQVTRVSVETARIVKGLPESVSC